MFNKFNSKLSNAFLSYSEMLNVLTWSLWDTFGTKDRDCPICKSILASNLDGLFCNTGECKYSLKWEVYFSVSENVHIDNQIQ